jgi:histidine ammonia-lyase
MKSPAKVSDVVFGEGRLSIEDVTDLAAQRRPARLSTAPEFVTAINRGAELIDRLLREDGVVYGVTTGYGDSCTVAVPGSLVEELPRQLYTFHGLGLGAPFDAASTRAVLAARLSSLSMRLSGVSYPLLKQIEQLLVHDLLPVIPQEGSVGASGDLTPLSYVAAVLCGERDVFDRGVHRPAAEALRERGLAPLKLRPKEGLAIMNGTAVMTGLACLAFTRAQYLSRLSSRITAMAVLAAAGNPHHFDETLFRAKPHPGQQRVAARLRADLGGQAAGRNEHRLQDRYSLRCAPHVIGVLEDAMPLFRTIIENELNSANDNPLVDADEERVLHGGHFYGGHIAFVMDSLKALVASIADLLDRQIAILLDPKFNHGLPANLSGAAQQRRPINHGLKALAIGASAWTAEALKLTMPAASFSRSTECHNQDKVSMGTIAARDCIRILELSEQVAVAALLAATQGVDLRIREGGLSREQLSPELLATHAAVRRVSPELGEDRALESELRGLLTEMRSETFVLYGAESGA